MPKTKAASPPIESVVLEGFKAHRTRVEFELAPLTVLAGANSSGKSSVMQGLLLLKQTSDAEGDRGPLRLDGPHVEFERWAELASHGRRKDSAVKEMTLGLRVAGGRMTSTFAEADAPAVALLRTQYDLGLDETDPRSAELVAGVLGPTLAQVYGDDVVQELGRRYAPKDQEPNWPARLHLEPRRERCFIVAEAAVAAGKATSPWGRFPLELLAPPLFGPGARIGPLELAERARAALGNIIHLPGHRGIPERRYPYSIVSGPAAPTPFHQLYPGVLLAWNESRPDQLAALGEGLRAMGLAWKVHVSRSTPSHVAIRVSRTPASQQGGASDLVPLPDVGFGVSQALPILVALLHAVPGQLVYVEQPEIHLHPKAQEALVELVVQAVRRKVRCVLETHSETILTAVQLAVARRNGLDSDDVRFCWFERDELGRASISVRVPTEAGEYGDWPVDFGGTMLDLQRRYIAAARNKVRSRNGR